MNCSAVGTPMRHSSRECSRVAPRPRASRASRPIHHQHARLDALRDDVAHAAPATPQPRTKTNSDASTMLTTLPTSVATIGERGRPRRSASRAAPRRRAPSGAARLRIQKYACVASPASRVADRCSSSGATSWPADNRRPRRGRPPPAAPPRDTPARDRRRPAPTACDTSVLTPRIRPNAKQSTANAAVPPMPTPASDAGPRCPTSSVSTERHDAVRQRRDRDRPRQPQQLVQLPMLPTPGFRCLRVHVFTDSKTKARRQKKTAGSFRSPRWVS